MKNHGFWMLLACLLPMVLIGLLFAFGGGNNMFALLLPLLCVGSHLLMMRGHRHEKQTPHDDHEHHKGGCH